LVYLKTLAFWGVLDSKKDEILWNYLE